MEESSRTSTALHNELRDLRASWRQVRMERLGIKRTLEGSGIDARTIRRSPAYRRLVKEQHRLSTRIRHIEKKLHRANAIRIGHDTTKT
ncbi:MAG TPA: hypothetical protein PKM65_03400 [Spirochaetota bacterium]|nr:hypothetical protein [Spirochaetota bacterium]HNT10870.1 hypothetical protein [Spirochaetota bacterium]HNV45952.1 hypothetical protein [Spirochaetota bacterium]HPI23776.1 hypothetical protein [Spirochaetota bacterium]HPU89008.1 hypothetical protein [Spirochaetota bacterium]